MYREPPFDAAETQQTFARATHELAAVLRVNQPASHASGQAAPKRIAFAQIDLNVAAAEVACLEQLYERIVPGGLVVLDDYGFARYRDSYEAERRFFTERGAAALELPTGQGLLLKR